MHSRRTFGGSARLCPGRLRSSRRSSGTVSDQIYKPVSFVLAWCLAHEPADWSMAT